MIYDFNRADGISANAYDFQGLAMHEIEEVLGHITGLQSSSAPQYATPFDLFRYTAKGVSSFSYADHAYFSIDGGATNLGNFPSWSSLNNWTAWLTCWRFWEQSS